MAVTTQTALQARSGQGSYPGAEVEEAATRLRIQHRYDRRSILSEEGQYAVVVAGQPIEQAPGGLVHTAHDRYELPACATGLHGPDPSKCRSRRLRTYRPPMAVPPQSTPWVTELGVSVGRLVAEPDGEPLRLFVVPQGFWV